MGRGSRRVRYFRGFGNKSRGGFDRRLVGMVGDEVSWGLEFGVIRVAFF